MSLFEFLEKINSSQIALEKKTVSSDYVLIIDEMYLQKPVQYHNDDFLEQDAEENLFRGIVVFMIVSFKKSIPIATHSFPETKITGEWLKREINQCILDLAEVGFKVRAIITDEYPSNVNAFTRLHVTRLCVYTLLTMAIFQESATAAIKSYFPNRLDAANLLTLFYKVFVI